MADMDNRILKKGVVLIDGAKTYKPGTCLGDIPEHVLQRYKPEKLKKLSDMPPKPEKKSDSTTSTETKTSASGGSPSGSPGGSDK